MKKIISTLSFALLCLAAASCGNNAGRNDSKEAAEDMNDSMLEGTHMEDNADFAVWAADAGMMEVQLGQLAQTNAASSQVKDFAQQMVDDHSKANDELKSYAQSRSITLPEALSNDRQQRYNELSAKTGADFDKEYVDQMVKDHKAVVDKFEDQSRETNDSELRAWLEGKLPALRHHLEMAQTLQDGLKK